MEELLAFDVGACPSVHKSLWGSLMTADTTGLRGRVGVHVGIQVLVSVHVLVRVTSPPGWFVSIDPLQPVFEDLVLLALDTFVLAPYICDQEEAQNTERMGHPGRHQGVVASWGV